MQDDETTTRQNITPTPNKEDTAIALQGQHSTLMAQVMAQASERIAQQDVQFSQPSDARASLADAWQELAVEQVHHRYSQRDLDKFIQRDISNAGGHQPDP